MLNINQSTTFTVTQHNFTACYYPIILS